ncbi:hypothetical protein [Kitasatospora griseola]|uniref:hypothetical protein n=1 Tax=Kitasatospora griseola TaxID=2064 RepID=UPI0038177712
MSQPVRSGIGPFGDLAGGWVPPEDLRRLQAYKVLAAYDQNQAGQPAFAAGDEAGLDRRELGDPAKINASALGYLLGASQQIVVPGAVADGGDAGTADAKTAADLQARLRDWARRELLPLRMQQCERAAVRFGDGVYTLAWDPQAGRPQLRTYDPGFFFPEFDDEVDGGEFPDRVHFAWELPEDPRTGRKARIRRITYEVGPIDAATRPVPAEGKTGRAGSGRAARTAARSSSLGTSRIRPAGRSPALPVGSGPAEHRHLLPDRRRMAPRRPQGRA